VVTELSPAALTHSAGQSLSVLSLVSGIIAHDLYHAGQIQLIKRMHKSAIKGERSR
jgi:hypothetical protein